MRIAVLGASGQLGSRLLARLRRDFPGAQVLGCVRRKSLPAGPGAAPHLLAFDPFGDDWQRLGRVDVLINCIGIIRETAAMDFARAHMGMTALMLRHRQQMGNPRLIQLSALGAHAGSPSGFLRTKGLADQALLQHPDAIVVRPSIVCTPGTMLSKKLQLLNGLCGLTAGLLPFPNQVLATRLQPVRAEDLTALVSALCRHSHPPKLVEAGGRETYTLRQLLEMMPRCRKVIPVPQTWFDRLLPLLSKLLPFLPDKEQQILLQYDNVASTGACERLLGRSMASTLGFWQTELAKGKN